jgi:hypothetical protein
LALRLLQRGPLGGMRSDVTNPLAAALALLGVTIRSSYNGGLEKPKLFEAELVKVDGRAGEEKPGVEAEGEVKEDGAGEGGGRPDAKDEKARNVTNSWVELPSF